MLAAPVLLVLAIVGLVRRKEEDTGRWIKYLFIDIVGIVCLFSCFHHPLSMDGVLMDFGGRVDETAVWNWCMQDLTSNMSPVCIAVAVIILIEYLFSYSRYELKRELYRKITSVGLGTVVLLLAVNIAYIYGLYLQRSEQVPID